MKALRNSFAAALRGIWMAIAGERNMKIHVGVMLLVVATGILVELSLVDWGLVGIAIGLVLTAELINTAVETLVNLVEPRQHPLAGKAKDIAAGAVLVAALVAVGIGVVVFYKYLPL